MNGGALDIVSVIIVNWNGREFLPKCLEGLKRQGYNNFCTILVDNGSNDGSIDFVIHSYPEVSVIALDRNFGFATANNIAIKTVHTEYVALLNNDAVAHPLWLQRV